MKTDNTDLKLKLKLCIMSCTTAGYLEKKLALAFKSLDSEEAER
jgi:hypothetical protein